MARGLTLGDLPLPALDKLMQHLDLKALVHLHVATGASMPAVKQQVFIMKVVHCCAYHWLRLSQRLIPPSRLRQLSDHKRQRQEQMPKEMQMTSSPCSKDQLLETLRSQISHINDAAALVHHWYSCQYLSWACAKGLAGICHLVSPNLDRMEGLNEQIRTALSLHHTGYLDFYSNLEDSNNKVSEFNPFADGDVQYHLEFSDQLLFICALYRLQQLHSGAALARLHGIFSTCCRCDLLMASRVLCLDGYNPTTEAEYLANKQDVPSTDILNAFGQSEPCIRGVISTLTAVQRECMMSCVQAMVDI